MNCQCEGIEQFFDPEEAGRDQRSYQKSGPHHSTQVLLDAIRAEGVDGKTVLDIGGGDAARRVYHLA